MSSACKRQTMSPDTSSSVKRQKVVQELFSEISQPSITPEPQNVKASSAPLLLTPRPNFDDDIHPSDSVSQPDVPATRDLFSVHAEQPAPPSSMLDDEWHPIVETPEGTAESDDHLDANKAGSAIEPAELEATAVDSDKQDEYSDASESSATGDIHDEYGSQESQYTHDTPEAHHVHNAGEAYVARSATQPESPPDAEGASYSAISGEGSASMPEAAATVEDDNMAIRIDLEPLDFELVVGKPWREQQNDTERFMQDIMAELAQLTADTHAWASLKVVQVDQKARDIIYTHLDTIEQVEAADCKAKMQMAEFAECVKTALLQIQLLSSV